MAEINASVQLLEALAVTAELTGTQLSQGAVRVMVDDLVSYPEPQVMGALTRCRRELRGRLTIAEIIARLDDGRPGPEEAWAMMPTSEAQSVVWTEEMAQAMGVAQPLIERGDFVAGRVAFLEAYRGLVTVARAERRPVKWFASLGHDRAGREGVIRKAYEQKRLTDSQVRQFLPPPVAQAVLAGLPAPDETPRLAAAGGKVVHIGEAIKTLKEALK